MYKLEIDIPITRRQRLHAVRCANGDLAFTCQTVTAAILWLAERGAKEFWLQLESKDGESVTHMITIGELLEGDPD